MGISYRDWVVETSTTTGTGTYNLSGSAPAGTSYFKLRDRYADGDDDIIYYVVNAARTKWEKNRFGTLTYGTPDTLTRNVIESTNGDAPVSWVGGDAPLRIYCAPDGDAIELAIGLGLGTSRPDVLKFGLWADQDDVSSGVHTLKLFDGTSDIAVGRIDTIQHKFMPFGFETGMVMPLMGATAPDGWILHTTTSIGDASSGATRANVDTKDLYIKLWTDFANAEAPVAGGRGVSAAADWAAHKKITIPDVTGRSIFGKEAVATRLTSGASGVDGAKLGASGGDQSLQSHAHGLSFPALSHINTGSGVITIDPGSSNGIYQFSTTGSTGGGSSQNVPPGIVLNFVIKL